MSGADVDVVARRTRHPQPETPQCEEPFTERQGSDGFPLQSWFDQREAKMLRRGYDPARCSRSSSWTVGGRDYCSIHAGAAALRVLETNGMANRREDD